MAAPSGRCLVPERRSDHRQPPPVRPRAGPGSRREGWGVVALCETGGVTTHELNALLDRLEDEAAADGALDADALYEGFTTWAEGTGRALYPHQEEALLEITTGSH